MGAKLQIALLLCSVSIEYFALALASQSQVKACPHCVWLECLLAVAMFALPFVVPNVRFGDELTNEVRVVGKENKGSTK